MGDRMADSGADIVISQHTHAVGVEERYNGAYLLYGSLVLKNVNQKIREIFRITGDIGHLDIR